MTAKITGISVQDFKRVKLVEIQPCENGLTILGGRNAQGKSSVLDAIAYALGGEAFRPSDINNHDADGNARIRVEIDGLVVERAGKNGALKIIDSRGMRGNQTLLNEIVSRFALDLGTFMQANDTEKAKLLLKMFPQLEGALAKLKAKADAIRVQRADWNRDRKRMQAQFDAMPKEDAPTQEINVLVIQDQLGEANADRMKAMNEKVEINSLENQALAEDDRPHRRRTRKDSLTSCLRSSRHSRRRNARSCLA
ncbi:MAG: AAA family ATPase [Victivallales bacterium]|nr:AAA family ATPase [Victivallales bacterium]